MAADHGTQVRSVLDWLLGVHTALVALGAAHVAWMLAQVDPSLLMRAMLWMSMVGIGPALGLGGWLLAWMLALRRKALRDPREAAEEGLLLGWTLVALGVLGVMSVGGSPMLGLLAALAAGVLPPLSWLAIAWAAAWSLLAILMGFVLARRSQAWQRGQRRSALPVRR